MDQTLAELHPTFYFIATLRLKASLEESDNDYANMIPSKLNTQLNAAYAQFIKYVLHEEVSARPLGILRPGILAVMEKLHALQKKGIIKHVAIYSNNGYLPSLEFIRDIIHEHLGTQDLICECIHWNHHMREEERLLFTGFATKTWSVLKKILVEGHCGASKELAPHDVHFFDDLAHSDLQRVLEANYYMVSPYTFKASSDRLGELYKRAIMHAKVDISAFMDYVRELFMNRAERMETEWGGLDEVIKIFKQKNGKTAAADDMPPPKGADTGIESMMLAAEKVDMIIGGLKRKRRGRSMRTSKQSQLHTVRRRRRRTSKHNSMSPTPAKKIEITPPSH